MPSPALPADWRDDLDRACLELLGERATVDRVWRYAPGGPPRGTLRVTAGSRTVYATRRQNPAVTQKEARVLQALHEAGAPVAPFLGFARGWLLSDDAGERLSERLADADPLSARALLVAAADGLEAIHRAGAARGLDDVPAFASGDGVGERLAVHLPLALSRRLTGTGALPRWERAAQARLLSVPGPAFIKWDARPANAALGPDGRIRWFDLQHCNVRWPADDLAWLLSDESVPPEVEPIALLAQRAAAAAPGWCPGGDPLAYAASMGAAHAMVRLSAQLDARADRDRPPSWAECLAEDQCGSDVAIERLFDRIAAAAALHPITAPIAPWMRSLRARWRADG